MKTPQECHDSNPQDADLRQLRAVTVPTGNDENFDRLHLGLRALTFVSPGVAPSDNRFHSTRFQSLRQKWPARCDGDHTTHKLRLDFPIADLRRSAQWPKQPSPSRHRAPLNEAIWMKS
jgi:hypothetical protein